MFCFEESTEGRYYQIMYFHNVFWGNFNFNLCIGYLAKLGGHLLLRDEIDVMLEGKC